MLNKSTWKQSASVDKVTAPGALALDLIGQNGSNGVEVKDRISKNQANERDLSYEDKGSMYNGSRGAHLNLKRAEKARVLVSKIP
ncbi:65-kDa microtubule-associated protein 1, partial [Tanacetum coccineum]